MITVHHLEESRSHRILWLLEELDVDYEIEHYERNPETKLAPDSLSDIHPLGKSPVITDGDHTVAESGAIIEYLLDHHGDGSLRPEPETDEHLRYRYWMHYAEGSAMPNLLLRIVFAEMPDQVPWPASKALEALQNRVEKEFITPRIRKHLDYWESELTDDDYFVGGEFTAADIQMSIPVEGAAASVEPDDYPRVCGLVDRLRDRPAYQAAVERGGGLSVPW